MEGVRPSSATAPSIWYEAVAMPHTKSRGNRASPWVAAAVSGLLCTLIP